MRPEHLGFKASETLLGIETRVRLTLQIDGKGFKASETLLGIETKTLTYQPNSEFESGFKASETLLGIETWIVVAVVKKLRLQSLWNPFRDWNFRKRFLCFLLGLLQSLWNPFRDWNSGTTVICDVICGFKASETLLGIETLYQGYLWNTLVRFKASETLLGIETYCQWM